MRYAALCVLAVGLAGCTYQPAVPPVLQAGWLVYSGDHVGVVATCGAEPIRLTGSHTEATLSGSCTNVQLTGNHNDVNVSLAPGGRCEVTGSSNDIWWTQSAPGPAPQLITRGKGVTFHAGHS